MPTDANNIQSKLHTYTEADESSKNAKNNRYHYTLRFEKDIGFEWLQSQVYKVSASVNANIEPYELRASDDILELTVREVDRRPSIDDSQKGLSSFEQ